MSSGEGSCDSCGKTVHTKDLTAIPYGEQGNSVADGSFCDECRGGNQEGVYGVISTPRSRRADPHVDLPDTGKANPSPPTQPDPAIVQGPEGTSTGFVAQPVPIQGEGRYKDGDSIQIRRTDIHMTVMEGLTRRTADIANAAWKEGHQAGASSKDQVVEAAAAFVRQCEWRLTATKAIHRFGPHEKIKFNNLATALNPNTETEQEK